MKNIVRAAALLTVLCMLCTLLPVSAQAQGGRTKGTPTKAPVVKVRTIGELKNYLHESLLSYSEVIELEYVEKLQPEIESGEVIKEMLNNSYGVEDASWEWSWEKTGSIFIGKLIISPIEYYNGIEIIKAVQNGTVAQLTEEQQKTLKVAQQMAQEIRRASHTLLEIERAVHDAICERVVYVESEEEGTTKDNAIGALLYGEAECDGYSDAFYLVGTLAGLNIGFQCGQAGDDLHLWNLIDIGGKWYHVDLTWNDIENNYDKDIMRYTYFNAGGGLMETHTWEPALSPYITEAQTDWDMYYYTGGGDGAYYTTIEDAGKYVAYRRDNGAEQMAVMVKGVWSYEQLHKAMKEASVYGRWTTWTQTTGGYTFFNVLFLE